MSQMIVSNKEYLTYMTKDIYFVYAIILGTILYRIWNNFSSIPFNKITFSIFALIIMLNSIITLANFPLIHPNNQKILIDHKDYIKEGIKKYEK